jgi:membrane protein DedA with SNARE-associated domain
VFALVAIETMGIPVPGETALFAAALNASAGHGSIELTIALAAAAAILGDNVGFAIGRKLGRRVFVKPGPMHAQRLQLLEAGEPFFARHGPKAVFLGRWVAGLRIASAWLAGMNKMRWPVFVFWNALGGVCWATSIGLGVYFAGHAFEHTIDKVGVYGAGVAVLVPAAILFYRHSKHRRERRARVAEIRDELAAAEAAGQD